MVDLALVFLCSAAVETQAERDIQDLSESTDEDDVSRKTYEPGMSCLVITVSV